MLVEENVWAMKMSQAHFRMLFDDPMSVLSKSAYSAILDMDPALYRLYQILNSGVTNGIPVISKADILNIIRIVSTPPRIDIGKLLFGTSAEKQAEQSKLQMPPSRSLADMNAIGSFYMNLNNAMNLINTIRPGKSLQAANSEIKKILAGYSPPPVRLHCHYANPQENTQDYICYGSAGSPVIMVRCPVLKQKTKMETMAFLNDLLAATVELPEATYPPSYIAPVQSSPPPAKTLKPKILLKHFFDAQNPSQDYYYVHFDTPVPSGVDKKAIMGLLADFVMYPALRIRFINFAIRQKYVVIEEPDGTWKIPPSNTQLLGGANSLAQTSLVSLSSLEYTSPCIMEVCHKSLLTVEPGWTIVGEAHDGSAWIKCPLPAQLRLPTEQLSPKPIRNSIP